MKPIVVDATNLGKEPIVVDAHEPGKGAHRRGCHEPGKEAHRRGCPRTPSSWMPRTWERSPLSWMPTNPIVVGATNLGKEPIAWMPTNLVGSGWDRSHVSFPTIAFLTTTLPRHQTQKAQGAIKRFFDCGWSLLSRGVANRKILEIWVS